jgi:IS5 family transposase
VFEQVQQQLQRHGYMARCGQIVDASLVQAPVQCNKRDEADTVKEGTMPLTWKPHKRAQKDVDARWTKKHGQSHFGYKLHARVAKRYKLIWKVAVTDAAVADTTVFETMLIRAIPAKRCTRSGPPQRRKRAQTGRLACLHPASGPRNQRYFRRAEAA